MPSSQEFLSPKIASLVLILHFNDSDRFTPTHPLHGIHQRLEALGSLPKERHPWRDFRHKTQLFRPMRPVLISGAYEDFTPISVEKLSTHAVLNPRL